MKGFMCAMLAVALVGPVARAQSLSPPLVEVVGNTDSKYELSNQTIFPQTVVLQAYSFSVDSLGTVRYEPLDTSLVKVDLATNSTRILPRQTYTVFYKAKMVGGRQAAWFVVDNTFSGARTSTGLNLRVELPHVVYMYQKEPLRQKDVLVSGVSVMPGVPDTAKPKVRTLRVAIDNQSDKLGRLLNAEFRDGSGKVLVDAGAKPIFPKDHRVIRVDVDPSLVRSVHLVFHDFDVTVPVSGL